MGLGLEVGYLADLLQNDAEGTAYFRKILDRLDPYLTSIGLSPHREPE